MLDVTGEQLDELRGILTRLAPGCTVTAFGSRVTGGARPFSDLDIVIRGSERMSIRRRALLREALEDSELPFIVDFHDWEDTDEAMRNAITARGVQIAP
jgi:type I restriction enzyme S subunit